DSPAPGRRPGILQQQLRARLLGADLQDVEVRVDDLAGQLVEALAQLVDDRRAASRRAEPAHEAPRVLGEAPDPRSGEVVEEQVRRSLACEQLSLAQGEEETRAVR